MTYLISNLSFPLCQQEPEFEKTVKQYLHCQAQDIGKIVVYKRSVDARKRDQIKLSYTLAVTVHEGVQVPESPYIKELREDTPSIQFGDRKMRHRPVIVGMGPAGMFCGLMLAKSGFCPIILEQGAPVEERVADIASFWNNGILNPNSNIQFGEGGAGTFSDGKLMTRINDSYCRYVLEQYVHCGAPEEIMMLAKPHIGTDLLQKVVVNLRNEIIALGGEVRFHERVTDIETENGSVTAVVSQNGKIPCETLILATGNAARPIFECCLKRGVEIAAKPFSVGVRIEHLQQQVDEALYGKFAGHPLLGHAEYQLSDRDSSTGRAVYTFCMCPGGVVVPAASEPEGIVTNGMSYHLRDGKNANSALAVSVDSRDFGNHPLAGIDFQRMLERAAYRQTGCYRAPIQTVGRFLAEKAGADAGAIHPTYAGGTAPGDFHRLFPQFITEKLKSGIVLFGRRQRGFNVPDALMTAPETRTSSPVRILRGEDYQSTSLRGLYPCGEGSGYAGGIMSSAVDGIHAALALIREYAPID